MSNKTVSRPLLQAVSTPLRTQTLPPLSRFRTSRTVGPAWRPGLGRQERSVAGMPKAQLAITAISVEKRSVSEAARSDAVVDLRAAGALRAEVEAALRR